MKIKTKARIKGLSFYYALKFPTQGTPNCLSLTKNQMGLKSSELLVQNQKLDKAWRRQNNVYTPRTTIAL